MIPLEAIHPIRLLNYVVYAQDCCRVLLGLKQDLGGDHVDRYLAYCYTYQLQLCMCVNPFTSLS